MDPQGICTRPSALTAVRSVRCLSLPRKEDQYTARTVSGTTGPQGRTRGSKQAIAVFINALLGERVFFPLTLVFIQ
jgi:hypothetical protein